MGGRRLLISALALLLTGGCAGHGATPGSAAGAAVRPCTAAHPEWLCGRAAANYLAADRAGWVVGDVGGTLVPLYLPTWRPPQADGVCTDYSVGSDMDSYHVKVRFVPCDETLQPAARQPPLAEWVVSGGTAQSLGPSPAGSPEGRAGQTAPQGATFYAWTAEAGAALLEWRRGGWLYQVVDTRQGDARGPLLREARSIRSAVGGRNGPVPGMSSGTVVDTISDQQTALWVIWQKGKWQYRVEGLDTSALSVASSMVPVQLPGAS